MEKIIKTTRFQILIIVIATVLVYINSLPNGLVWDDHLFVEKWKEMQNFDIVSLVKGSAPEAQGKIYRPVRSIIYAIDYKLWGQNPFFYHLQAILIHVGVTVLVYYIVRLLTKDLPASVISRIRQLAETRDPIRLSKRAGDSSSRRISGLGMTSDIIPFTAALLFGLHPIHTETIDYISASMETWGSLFFFLSFYLYLMPTRPRLARLGSIVSALLAFFTYEMTLTLPFLIVLYEYFAGRIGGVRAVRWIRRVFPYFVIAFSYLFIRIFILNILTRTEYLAYSFYHTMLVMVKVFAQYILLLFFPFNLTTNHRLVGDFPSSMLPYDKLDPILRQSIFDKDVLLGILGILGILGAALYCRKKFPLITFGTFWFFISLLPVSYIIPHGGAMAEKYLYIPSLGFVVILAYLVQSAKCKVQSFNSKFKILNFKLKFLTFNFELLICLLLATFYGILTFQRNIVWRNDITLFTDMEKKAPNNLLATYTLGVLYGERNHFNIAEKYYQKAINKAPDFWEAHYNLGNIYTRVGREVLAKREYEKVLQINKDFTPARNNLELLNRHSGEPSPSPSPARGEGLGISSPLRGEDKGEGTLFPPLPVGEGRVRGDFVTYSFNEISFEYPKTWNIKKTEGAIVISDESKEFIIEIMLDKKKENVSTYEYVSQEKESFGKLVNQGLAKVPEFDFAYVKVWDDTTAGSTGSLQAGSRQRLQFFLFKKDLVVKVLVYPSNSPNMKQFDTILGSIKLI